MKAEALSIDVLDLYPGDKKVLATANCKTLGDIIAMGRAGLLRIPRMGRGRLARVQKMLMAHDLQLPGVCQHCDGYGGIRSRDS